jgi:NAD(P)H-hydrate epimerase
MSILPIDPILSCKDSLAFEANYFAGDLEKEWLVMNRAGEGIGDSLLRDMRELRTIPHRPRLLVLAGKGHNGGDALIAAKRFLKTIPTATAVLWPYCSWSAVRPLCKRAYNELVEFAGKRIVEVKEVEGVADQIEIESKFLELFEKGEFAASIDGFLGMQAKLPLNGPLKNFVSVFNNSEKIGVRAAVDLPTGLTDGEVEDVIAADFTYSTGIAKTPITKEENQKLTGRIRYLELGFFEELKNPCDEFGKTGVIRSSALKILRKLRPVISDKRSNGHLFLLAGSRHLGGAAMMAAQAALKAGVGLLTVGVPESLHASFVASRPEAMWIPLPETPDGCLALEGLGLIRKYLGKVSALAVGPGVGEDAETHSLIRETVNFWKGPAVLDADALRSEILEKVSLPERLVLTPHLGELARITKKESVFDYSIRTGSTIVLKGAHSQVISPKQCTYSFSGSSILARGGSGDLLTGIIGALLAKEQFDLFSSTLLSVLWHGRAAEVLARQHGQEAVNVTDILDYLSFAIRNDF